MDKMNMTPEEQNIDEVEEQNVSAPESTVAEEPVVQPPAPKAPMPKPPFFIGCVIAGVAAISAAVITIVGGGLHEHGFGEWRTTDAPTCLEAGVEERVCDCGEKETRPVDALGHIEIIDTAVEATCTSTGLTEGKHCSTCGTIIAAQTPVDKIPHTYDNENDADCNVCGETRVVACTHVETEIIPDKSATCTSTGLTDGEKCKSCGEIIIEQTITPTSSHTETILTAVEASCSETGLTEGVKCSVCDEILVEQQEVPKAAHTEVKIPKVNSTCSETGLTEGVKCSVCGEILVEQQEIPKGTHTEVEISAVEASCTKTGLTSGKKCSVCGEILIAQQETPKIAHTYDNIYDESCNVCGYIRDAECAHLETETILGCSATCTTTGLTDGTRCKTCDEILVAPSVIPIEPHTEVIDSAVESTCTVTGLTEGKHCLICDTVIVAQETIDMKPHTEAVTPAVEATCAATGLTEGKHCSVCEKVLEKQDKIAKYPHSYDDKNDFECNDCGFERQARIHSIVIDSENQTITITYTVLFNSSSPQNIRVLCNELSISGYSSSSALDITVSEAGTYTKTFDFSKYISKLEEDKEYRFYIGYSKYSFFFIPSTVSDFYAFEYRAGEILPEYSYEVIWNNYDGTALEKDKVSVGETHSYDGSAPAKEGDEIYSYAFNEWIGKIINVYGDTVYTADFVKVEYVCLHDDCNTVVENNLSPTCTVAGSYDNVNYCKKCGEEISRETITVPATGHTEVTDPAVEATCTTTGLTEGKHCSVCGGVVIAQTIVEAVGHSYGDWIVDIEATKTEDGKRHKKCSGCNDIIEEIIYATGSEGLQYTLSENGLSYYVSGIGTCTDIAIAIPSMYNNLPVTSIASSAFKNCTSFESITIPDSLTSIGDKAFYNCTSLAIVIIPNFVTSIGDDAFSGCKSLTIITIPSSVTSIGGGAFSNCILLTSIEVDEKNEYYKSIDGNLYSKDETALVQYAVGKHETSFIIPDSVKSIGYKAFHGCSSLESIVIPDSVTSIGSYAFFYCTSLKSVVIPNSVTNIDNCTFAACTSLASILVPDSVTSVGISAFQSCSSLTSIIIPDSVTSIGLNTFLKCDSLTIYCAVASQPSGWNSLWNPDNRPVHWGYDYDHMHVEVVDTAVSATCTTTGLTEGKHCSVCGAVIVAQTVIPAKGHTEVTDAAVSATCTTTGLTEGKHCSVCSAVIVAQNVIPAKGHTESDWQDTPDGTKSQIVCTVCGAVLDEKKYSIELEFTFNADENSYTVTGMGTCVDENIIVPEYYEGLPVTRIGEKAFYGCATIITVKLPNSIIEIQDKAFSECVNLISISMPDNIVLGKDVFRGSINIIIIIRHLLTYVEYKEPTCTEPGNIAYWWCEHCNVYYEDKEQTVRLYDVIIPTSHSFVDGVCEKCGKIQDELLIVSVETVGHLGEFPLGTLESAIGLPNKLNVYTADGLSHQVSVSWDLSAYDKSIAGTYTLIGILESGHFHYADGVENHVSATITVIESMKGTADIVFILDISGSMEDEINHVKNNIINLSQALFDKGISVRFSAITFSDYTYDSSSKEQTQVIMNGSTGWFTDVNTYKTAISSIKLAYGGDLPEVAIDGLMHAKNNDTDDGALLTRKDARVFYILLTDATFKTNNHYGVSDMSEAADILAESDINTSVITTSGNASKYSQLTDKTGGIYANINGDFATVLLNNLVPIIYEEVIS